MNYNFCFQSALFITTITSTVLVSPSSFAFEIVFSSPNVLSGIKGVSFTLPSTSETKTYNIVLEEGSVFDVYGNPPKFDVFTSLDAKTAMEESAQGINFYLANVSQDISFGSLGTDIFYIPYAFNPSTEKVAAWSSGVKVPDPDDDGDTKLIEIDQVDLIADTPVVYVSIQKVPEPLTGFGSIAALGIGALLKREHSKKQKKI